VALPEQLRQEVAVALTCPELAPGSTWCSDAFKDGLKQFLDKLVSLWTVASQGWASLWGGYAGGVSGIKVQGNIAASTCQDNQACEEVSLLLCTAFGCSVLFMASAVSLLELWHRFKPPNYSC
jgi:hypothetical protein